MHDDSAADRGNSAVPAWRCTFCSELNGPEIYRCSNCRHSRELTAPTELVDVPVQSLSEADKATVAAIRRAGAIRAAWLYVRWQFLPHSVHARWPGVVFALAAGALLVMLILARPYDDLRSALIASLGWLSVMTLFAAVGATKYRSGPVFLISVAAICVVVGLGVVTLFYVLSVAVPMVGGEPALDAAIHAVNPRADARSVGVVVAVALLATMFAVGLLSRRWSRGADAPG